MLRMLLVRKRSSVCAVVEGPPWPAGRVTVCVRVGWSTVCESENVWMRERGGDEDGKRK